jgi:hypothetical protein
VYLSCTNVPQVPPPGRWVAFVMPLLPATTELLAFENQAGRLYYQPAGYVRLAWAPGRLALPVIQEFYEQVLSLLIRTNVRRILSEHGQREPLSQAAQQWISTDWIPRAMRQARTQHCAIVEGANPVHRLSTQSVVSSAPDGFLFRRFDTFAPAAAWLCELAL